MEHLIKFIGGKNSLSLSKVLKNLKERVRFYKVYIKLCLCMLNYSVNMGVWAVIVGVEGVT